MISSTPSAILMRNDMHDERGYFIEPTSPQPPEVMRDQG
jgi:hypothetical protein